MRAERTFIDTNVLTYVFDDAEPAKRDRARERLEAEQGDRDLVVSTQVLQELYVSLTKGRAPIASPEIAEAAVREAGAGYIVVQVDVALIMSSIESSRRARISFWDAMIIRAAAASGCDRLLSEDLNPDQVIDGVRIENPFA